MSKRYFLLLSVFMTLNGLASSTFAIEPATGKHTVIYSSSGPSRPDGYENAQINLQYQFTDCPGGITLGFRVMPGSANVSQRYWHQGTQLNPQEAAPRVERVEFVADIMYRGKRISRLSFVGNHHASTNSRLGCGGLTMGRFPDFLPAGYTEADKVQMFRELVIWTDKSPSTLTNPAIGQRIASERQTAATQRLANEQLAQKKVAAEKHAADKLTAAQTTQAQQAPSSPKNSTTTQHSPPPSPSQQQALNNLAHMERMRHEESLRAQRQVDQSAQKISNHLTLESATHNTARRIASLTTLSDNINSIEQLDAEYERRRDEIDAAMDDYASQQQASSANIHRAFDNQAVGMATQSLVTTLQQYNNNNARFEAQQELQREHDRLSDELEKRYRQALVGGRQALLDEFQDAPLPRYSDRIEGSVVYYFAYSLNPAEISRTSYNPSVYLTNVFAVAQRGDGGWPLRSSLDVALASVIPQGRKGILAGFFVSEQEAIDMRNAFARLAQQSQLNLQQLQYESSFGKRAGATTANFWGTQANSTAPVKVINAQKENTQGAGAKQKPVDTDFWDDNKATPPSQAPTSPPDFWQ